MTVNEIRPLLNPFVALGFTILAIAESGRVEMQGPTGAAVVVKLGERKPGAGPSQTGEWIERLFEEVMERGRGA